MSRCHAYNLIIGTSKQVGKVVEEKRRFPCRPLKNMISKLLFRQEWTWGCWPDLDHREPQLYIILQGAPRDRIWSIKPRGQSEYCISMKMLGMETIQVWRMEQKLRKKVHDGREEVGQETHPEFPECVHIELCGDRTPGGASGTWDIPHWVSCLSHSTIKWHEDCQLNAGGHRAHPFRIKNL